MSRITVTQNLRLLFFGVLLFASAQVFWWLFDLGQHGEHDVRLVSALYEQDSEAAARLLNSGVTPAEVEELFPHLRAGVGGVAIAPEALSELRESAAKRKNQYLWEGGFFLLVLIVMMLILRRTIAAETELRRRQEDFVAAVSHEIKSPLASLQLAVETMERRPLEAEGRSRHLKRIRSDVRRLSSMISNILDSTKLARGDIELRPELLPVARLVALELDDIRDRAAVQDVTVESDVSSEARLVADPGACRIVVRNLLENAVNATGANGGGRVQVSFSSHGASCDLEVRDEGIGFREEEASRLFEAFYRVGSELRRETPGSGLGLAIVKRYLQLEGATVKAHSDGQGKGASFTVSWPQRENNR